MTFLKPTSDFYCQNSNSKKSMKLQYIKSNYSISPKQPVSFKFDIEYLMQKTLE